eukprot:gb/GECG01004169.1/.p1 GENE.gb/GECG01004169.1/~~gb/GECG01004169.1/.p1  ORF type:complete len:684 (+),score=91.35 gb/GECG01004169.1/:1-2052(+)
MPRDSERQIRKRQATTEDDCVASSASNTSSTKAPKSSHASSITTDQTANAQSRSATGKPEDETRCFLQQWTSKFEEEAKTKTSKKGSTSFAPLRGENIAYLMQELFVFFNEVESEESIEILGSFSRELASNIRLYLSNWAQVIMVRRQTNATAEEHAAEREDRIALYALEILAYLVHAYPAEVASLSIYKDEVFQAIIYACLRARDSPKWLHASILLWTWMGTWDPVEANMSGSSLQRICTDLITTGAITLDICLPWVDKNPEGLQRNNVKMVGQQILLLLRRGLYKLPINNFIGADDAILACEPSRAVLMVQVLLLLLWEDPQLLQNPCSDSQTETAISQMESEASATCECVNETGVKLLRHCPQHSPSFSHSGDCILVVCLLANCSAKQYKRETSDLQNMAVEEDISVCLSVCSRLISHFGTQNKEAFDCLDCLYDEAIDSSSLADLSTCEHVLYRRLVCQSILNVLSPNDDNSNARLVNDIRRFVSWLDGAHPFCNTCFQLLQEFATAYLENDELGTRYVERISDVLEYLQSHEFAEEENRYSTRIIGASLRTLMRSSERVPKQYSQLLQWFENCETLSSTRVSSALEQSKNILGTQSQDVSTASPAQDRESTTAATERLMNIFSTAQLLLEDEYTESDIRKAKEKSLGDSDAQGVAEVLHRIGNSLQGRYHSHSEGRER